MIRYYHIFFIFIVFLATALPAGARAQQPLDDGFTAAKQAIVVDYDTGAVLYEKEADMRMPTSSMSKVITMYLVFEALKDGRLASDASLPVSEKAWRMEGSKMFVEVGKNVPVEQLIQGVIVQSGNDATVVLAEGLAGTEESFADALNAKAAALGMKNSHFTNASGWPDPDHYSTARDLATLAAHTIRDFPDYYHYFAELEYTYNNIKQHNRNPLLAQNIGADGLKTGHTEDGGYGLMGSGTQGGRRVILVLNGLPDEKARAQESRRLLEWGLRSFENVKLFSQGEAVETAPVVMGKAAQVPLAVEKDIAVTLPIALRNDLKVELVYDGPLIAPVAKGQAAGKLIVTVPRGQTLEVPLVAGEDVPALGPVAGLLAKAKLIFGGGAPPAQAVQ